MMKMIVALMKDEDTDNVTQAMAEVGLCVTRIASTGGFLRQGQSTLMIGVEEDLVDQTIQMINDNIAYTVEPVLKRATLFVLNVEHFEQI
jgi:uncharacterized protein YaaQ